MRLGILLVFYLLSEFYVYNHFEYKKFSLKKIIIHSIVYSLLLIIFLIRNYDSTVLIIILFMILTHYLIHLLIILMNKIIKNESILFIIEQTLHLIIIFGSVYIIDKEAEILNVTPLLRIVLSLLLLAIPGNTIFKKLFSQFKPDDNIAYPTFKNAGATIGVLERFLIFICLASNLYTSIGLIFTAKSIARYKRINDEPAFSEYYLIGTLFSLLYTIVIYFLIFWYL